MFKAGDRVRIKGMTDVFTISEHGADDDDIILDSPYGRFVIVDYRGLEHVTDEPLYFGMNKKDLLFLYGVIEITPAANGTESRRVCTEFMNQIKRMFPNEQK